MTADQKNSCSQITSHGASPELLETLQRMMRNADTLLQVPDAHLALFDVTGSPLVAFPAGSDLSCPIDINLSVYGTGNHKGCPGEAAPMARAGQPLRLPVPYTDIVSLQDTVLKLMPIGTDASPLREGIIIDDMSRDPRFSCLENAISGSLLCVALIEREQSIGTLIAHSPQIEAFSRQHLRMLAFVAEQIALVIGMKQQAEQEAIQARTKILSTVTHELRSPINTINGYLDLALSGVAGELNTELREFIQRARSGSENLFALLEDALLIARADAGQLRLSRERVNLQDVIIDAVEEMELTARDHEIEVVVEIDEELPSFYADATRLQQVVRDLLSNALNFTPAGGQVTVSASSNRLDLDATAEPRQVKLQVMDTGCGIAPEFQQRIFERFFQVPDGQRRGRKGQGLGLAAVKMIVELHGGIISVASEPGQGSRFLCVLPVS